jgi:iron(III) transport system permease protein
MYRGLRFLSPWTLSGILLALLVVFPILLLVWQWGTLTSVEISIWEHLLEAKILRLTINTLLLVLGVGVLTAVLGTGLAWLVTMCEFPGRQWLEWGLMLPLSVPGYVMAFVYLALFNYSGPVQSLLRDWFGSSHWFPSVQSAPGVILVLSLALYPYVYMLVRAAFLSQGRQLMDAARCLGQSPWQAFMRVAVPAARPAIAGGVALVLMETLADFGAVSVFNFDTFTTAIYNAWYGLFNLAVAAQLATILMLFVTVTLMLETYSRRGARYYSTRVHRPQRYKLIGMRKWIAIWTCLKVIGFAFILPLGQLVYWLSKTGLGEIDSRYPDFLGHTLALGLIAGVITTVVALLLVVSKRFSSNSILLNLTQRLATLGYALPGSVLAVGILLSLTLIERTFEPIIGLRGMLIGTVVALLIAYLVRFLAVAHAPVEAGINFIRPVLVEVARTLGTHPITLLRRIYIPLLRPGLLTALILVFVDVMKEMPATLILRPFGWDTLAVRIYQMTAEGQWERAALPAVTLLIIGLIPVLMLIKSTAVETSSHK